MQVIDEDMAKYWWTETLCNLSEIEAGGRRVRDEDTNTYAILNPV
jgi:hypothetical protein